MAKTCGVCEKSTEVGRVEKCGHTVKRWCRCSVTGMEHADNHPCDVPEKPRLCEVLGVDVGQRFYFDDQGDQFGPFTIRENGQVERDDLQGIFPHVRFLAEAINHPETIIRLPRLTEPELAICRATGAKWVGRCSPTGDVPPEDVWTMLFSGRPKMGDSGPRPEKETYIGALRPELFPSVGLGDLIHVEDEP